MKIIAGLAALLFAYSAFLQWNDPDPVRWIALYSCAAVLSVASIFEATPRPMLLSLAGVAGIWSATLVPGVLKEAACTGTEEEAVLWRSGTRRS